MDYSKLSAAQRGALVLAAKFCAICNEPGDLKFRPNRRPWGARHLCLDHDSATGRVRGVLCSGCNTALGLFRHNIAFLERAITYLTVRKPLILPSTPPETNDPYADER